MNEDSSYQIYGACCPTKTPAGFCIPIFRSSGVLYVQAPLKDGTVGSFVKLETNLDPIIETDQKWRRSAGDFVTHAFLFPDGKVHLGDRKSLQMVLRERISEISQFPFITLEVLDFIEDFENIPAAVSSAASLMKTSNPHVAEVWEKMQVEPANSSRNLAYHRHARNELISLLQQPTDSWLQYRKVYWDNYCDLVQRFCDDQRLSNQSLTTWWINELLRPVRLQLRFSETMVRGIVIHTMTAIELYSHYIGEEQNANQMKESKLRMLFG